MMSAAHVNAPVLIDQILDAAVRAGASDIHFEPTGDALEVRFRIDGVLQTMQTHDKELGRSLVTRLMVMAHLLTYRLDVPQEGRVSVSVPASERALDLRLSIMPTTRGLRGVLRMPAELVQPRGLSELSLPGSVMRGLEKFAHADAGMLIVTGPAGSGKTTTIYALLQHIAATSQGLSIVTLEDPVERKLAGVTQIEVSPFGELTYERTLRSMLRQDPQVLMLGEIRDAATASLAVQAALSGHRMVSTLHAATPAGAMARLLEMGVEPYQITSALFGVVAQRLLRRRSASPGLAAAATRRDATGGYAGRVPAAEFVEMDANLRKAVLKRADAAELAQIYADQKDSRPMRLSAGDLVAAGITDDAEVTRIFGP